jgi:hypothetical protein
MLIRQLTATLALLAIACISNVACSRSEGDKTSENKAIAERALGSNKGAVALVFNEEGEVISATTRDGRALQACQICTPEMERKYGAKCEKARRASDALKEPSSPREDRPLICDKLMNTNVQAVNPISVIKHTGSQCVTYMVYNGGTAKILQYCW